MLSSKIISDHYNKCFLKHGDSHLGADWPNKNDLIKRYTVMLESIRHNKASVLDFGCGTGMLLDFLKEVDAYDIKYFGLDINESLILRAREKHPNSTFLLGDIHSDNILEEYDYIISNGVFTEKLTLSQDEMFDFFSASIKKLFNHCKYGLSFNVMSSHVDYEREDLFHLSHDVLADFIVKNLSRNYIIRNDYGLYEYTVYVYKESLH